MFKPDEKHLLHTALRDLSRAALVMRSSFPFKYFYPESDRISWYGGAIRYDGGQGMYMTGGQAMLWTKWVKQDDITVGPL